MEFIILIGALVVFFICFTFLVYAVVRLLRALFRLPQKKNDFGWASHEDFLFGKPLNRYERRERKGRIHDPR